MSRRANCWDNAPVENFWNAEGGVHPSTTLLTFEEVKSIIADYIYFYNYERIQLKTRKTPFEVRCLSELN
jgi:transposase InsO family protein